MRKRTMLSGLGLLSSIMGASMVPSIPKTKSTSSAKWELNPSEVSDQPKRRGRCNLKQEEEYILSSARREEVLLFKREYPSGSVDWHYSNLGSKYRLPNKVGFSLLRKGYLQEIETRDNVVVFVVIPQ